MSRKTLLIAAAILFVAAFLLGFVPQYLGKSSAESRLNDTTQQLSAERESTRMDGLGLLIGYVYLQTNLKNYGIASQYATKYFDRARAMASQTADAGRQAFLNSVLAKRDDVIGGLAKGDGATLGVVQDLFQRTLDATPTGWK
jgi:hypothetical protein